ncbi:MAG: DUF3549 family protein [Gammaproteobacteria bacterium]|nr:DUF3549 family protein [Gammaproteobacteria bacterium]MCP5137026.1 DUF3549 family protein [Gammaproteobacteria bacterium]
MTETMKSLDVSIGGLLKNLGVEAVWFEMGRRVQPLGRGEVLAFEAGQAAYPYPLLRKAWLGILFWSPESRDRPSVWFFKLSLDEQGLIEPAVRDDFIRHVAEQLSRAPDAVEGDSMPDNPHAFSPSQERLAMFHALASKLLGNPGSRYYENARDYFAGRHGFDGWRFIGMQGIADVVARLDEDDNAAHVASAIETLPVEPLGPLCACLENQVTPVAIARALAARLASATGAEEAATLLRGLSLSVSPGVRDAAVRTLLAGPYATHSEVLAAIVNRVWECLLDDEIRALFLAALADNRLGQELFDEAMFDLSYLPGMRGPLLASLRNPERSEALSQAVGRWFQRLGV